MRRPVGPPPGRAMLLRGNGTLRQAGSVGCYGRLPAHKPFRTHAIRGIDRMQGMLYREIYSGDHSSGAVPHYPIGRGGFR